MLTYSTLRWSQTRFLQYLFITFNTQLLYNMAFNSYIAIKIRISEACNVIYDGWYTNCVQATSIYEVFLCRLQRQ